MQIVSTVTTRTLSPVFYHTESPVFSTRFMSPVFSTRIMSPVYSTPFILFLYTLPCLHLGELSHLSIGTLYHLFLDTLFHLYFHRCGSPCLQYLLTLRRQYSSTVSLMPRYIMSTVHKNFVSSFTTNSIL